MGISVDLLYWYIEASVLVNWLACYKIQVSDIEIILIHSLANNTLPKIV